MDTRVACYFRVTFVSGRFRIFGRALPTARHKRESLNGEERFREGGEGQGRGQGNRGDRGNLERTLAPKSPSYPLFLCI